MSDTEFNIGDVVILKSGGPLMTVTNEAVRVTAIWFDVNHVLHEEIFQRANITLVKEK